MANNKTVKVVYTERNLAMKYGVKPVSVTPGHAQHLKSQGFARILQAPPQANPDISKEELDELKKRYEEDSVSYMLEERLLTKIAWVCGGMIDRQLRTIGMELGFRLSIVNSMNFSIGKLLLPDLIIISSNLSGFSESQLVHLRAIVFQKHVPFIFRLETEEIDTEDIKHFLMDSKLNVFANGELFIKTVDMMGEMLGGSDWFVETGEPYDFWRKINGVGK